MAQETPGKGLAKLGKKDAAYVAAILALAAVLAFGFFQGMLAAGSQQKVLAGIEGVYRNLTESDVEIVQVKDEGYLYRILLRLRLPEGDALREVYSTKDGRFFSEAGNVIELSSFVPRLEGEKRFAECLRAKEFFVLGQKSQPETVQQLLVIGNFANKVFVECSGANLQACLQIGISEIPTVLYDKMNYTGVKDRAWIEDLTGCK